MRTQIEMFNYLKENIKSHEIEIKGNKIIAKRQLKARGFSSFILTYLKNGEVALKNTSFESRTLKFNDDENLFCQLGSMSNINY